MTSLTGIQIFMTACEIVQCNDWSSIWLAQLFQKRDPPWLPIRFVINKRWSGFLETPSLIEKSYNPITKWSWQRSGSRCLTFSNRQPSVNADHRKNFIPQKRIVPLRFMDFDYALTARSKIETNYHRNCLTVKFSWFSPDLENCDADFIRYLSLSKVTMRRSLRVTSHFQVMANSLSFKE